MRYEHITNGIFLERPNRFLAKIEVNGCVETVHVKNTGRCRELLVPGAQVRLEESLNPQRKTRYDLIGVEKRRDGLPPLSINMDSQAPNAAAEEWLHRCGMFSPQAEIRREATFGNSRFDLFIQDGQRKCFMEVKGVTLEHDGIAYFPDAPTQRGVKHLHELAACMEDGYEAYLLFVIQMKEIRLFRPNDATHAEFGTALREAAAAGVKVMAMDCLITQDSMEIDCAVPVDLTQGYNHGNNGTC